MRPSLPYKRPPRSEAEVQKGYRVSWWKGQFLNFQCCYCLYDSLDEAEVQDHIFQIHIVRESNIRAEMRKPNKRSLSSLLFDASGKPIEEMESPYAEID